MITIKQIEALYWIHRLGSITAAAEKLHTSQSAVTKRIGELEQYFNVSLIDRGHRRSALTPKGLEVYQLGKELLRNRDELQSLLADRSSHDGKFRVGVTELAAVSWMGSFAEAFRSEYPGVKLEAEVTESPRLLRRLLDGALDFAVLETSFQDPRVGVTVLYEEDLSWMCRPGLLDADRMYSFEELAERSLLSPGPGSSLAALYDQLFGVRGFLQKSTVIAPSLASLAALTRAGFGVCCLPTLHFSNEIGRGEIQVLQVDMPALRMEFAAMYRYDGVSGLAKPAVDLAKKCIPIREAARPQEVALSSQSSTLRH
jgi:DNA-binding transcriptional LysR family regulator